VFFFPNEKHRNFTLEMPRMIVTRGTNQIYVMCQKFRSKTLIEIDQIPTNYNRYVIIVYGNTAFFKVYFSFYTL